MEYQGEYPGKEQFNFRFNVSDLLQHLPWANNRPYNDGDLYNCLVIETLMKDVGKPHFERGEVTVGDEVYDLLLV